ncbi:hypothetical protein [Bacillus wiedmannii]
MTQEFTYEVDGQKIIILDH